MCESPGFFCVRMPTAPHSGHHWQKMYRWVGSDEVSSKNGGGGEIGWW